MDEKKHEKHNPSLSCKVEEGNAKQVEKSAYPINTQLNAKKPRINGPSNNNASHQNQPKFDFSCNQQPASSNQVSPANSIPNQYQPYTQLNADFHQAQQFQQSPHLGPSFPPGFSPSQWAHSVGSYHPFPQMGSLDNNWQVPTGNGPVTGSNGVGSVPNGLYQFGYPCPPYSAGPWDPSFWWGQVQPFPPPYGIYPFPGANNYSPSPALQPAINCSTASENSSEIGAVQPSEKISQKEQSLWDAQLAKNVQLCVAIAALQANLDDVRSRLIKFETEFKSLQSKGEQQTTHDTGITSTVQTKKRGRPKKFVALADASPSPNESYPSPCGRKPALSTAPLIKEINFQKDDKDKAEFLERISPLIPTQHANDQNLSSMSTSKLGDTRFGQPAYQNPNYTNIPQSQVRTIVPDSFLAKAAVSNIKRQVEKLTKQPSTTYLETIREMMNATSQGLYRQVNVSDQGTGDCDDSVDLDEGMAESDKEEDEEIDNVTATCSDDKVSYCAKLQKINSGGFPRR